MERLEQLALFGGHEVETTSQSKSGESFSHAGLIVRSLSEFNVRNICGEAVYGAGLQNYSQGRVSKAKFSRNTLAGRLDERGRKWLSSSDPQFFDATITLERNSKKPRISGSCACSLAKEGSVCTHMAALLIAWVRKPQDFEDDKDESRKTEFQEARQQAISSLRELAGCIRESSSTPDDLRLLQRTRSRLRIWAADAREATVTRNENGGVLAREFSDTINSISRALMSAIEVKYNINTTDLYNASTVSTFTSMLDLFLETTAAEEKNSAARAPTRRQAKKLTARSWDTLVENYAR
jgi:hypothetical protein